jgi:hypothetical protein
MAEVYALWIPQAWRTNHFFIRVFLRKKKLYRSLASLAHVLQDIRTCYKFYCSQLLLEFFSISNSNVACLLLTLYEGIFILKNNIPFSRLCAF